MRKKFLVLATAVTLFAAMTACGSSNSAKDNTSEMASTETKEKEDKSSEKTEETSKKGKIAPVKEEDIVVDFDGIKLPLCITWEDFQKFMTENNWTLVDDKVSFPRYERNDFSGGGEILTNCGIVDFRFMENETNTESVLRSIYVSSDNSGTKVSVNGITCKTTEKELAKSLTAKEGSDAVFYMDDFVVISLCETEITDTDELANLHIIRTPFHMR